MLNSPKIDLGIQPRSYWRSYQRDLQRTSRFKRLLRSLLACSIITIVTFVVVYQIIGSFLATESRAVQSDDPASHALKPDSGDTTKRLWDKTTLQGFLDRRDFINLDEKVFQVFHNGQTLNIETSLNLNLQQYIQKKLKLSTSRYIAIVIMEPTTGKVLSMVSYDKTNPARNPNIDKPFPAASIFKIVTAAAAIEKFGFDANTRFFFNGRKHTLYKSQLKQSKNKYSQKISLRDAFAQSVNPVFGKIGVHYLKADDLAVYASGFGFNRPISFEIPVMASSLDMSDEPYQWAEIACGFNRETLITPLHGVSIASAILNQGRLIQPSIIEKITDENGRTLYSSNSAAKQIITPKTSEIMHRLMAATIERGTARKAFSGFRRDKTLSRLAIGGKTGSINNEQNDTRYDWFVGYAEEKNGTEKIALSILVAHEKYIGIKASEYARLSIKKYFQDYFLASAR